jgi:hypothetical protein
LTRVSNEKKNLNRLAGEFLVASRLTQRGYMVTLQWGTTIGYDILVFDKGGNVAFREVKSSAQYARRWILQKKYAEPDAEAIPLDRRFICCVDLAVPQGEPRVYVLPAAVVAQGLHYLSRVVRLCASEELSSAHGPVGAKRHRPRLGRRAIRCCP